MYKIIFVLLTGITSSACFAAAESISMGKRITKVSTYEAEAVIYYSPSESNNQDCTNTTLSAVKIDISSDLGRNILSTALTAATASKDVAFGIHGCLGGNLPKVYRIDVEF